MCSTLCAVIRTSNEHQWLDLSGKNGAGSYLQFLNCGLDLILCLGIKNSQYWVVALSKSNIEW